MKTAGGPAPRHDAPRSADSSVEPTLVAVRALRTAGDSETCLRPLGLCELGGACDSCWYRPDHPRFSKPG